MAERLAGSRLAATRGAVASQRSTPDDAERPEKADEGAGDGNGAQGEQGHGHDEEVELAESGPQLETAEGKRPD